MLAGRVTRCRLPESMMVAVSFSLGATVAEPLPITSPSLSAPPIFPDLALPEPIALIVRR